MQKTFLYIVLVAFIVLTAGAIFSASNFLHSNDSATPDAATDTDPENNTAADGGIVGEGVTFTITEGGHKKWELRVKEAIHFADRSGAELTDVTGEFFDENEKAVVQFHAPTGTYNKESKAVTLKASNTARVRVHTITSAGEDDNKSNLTASTVTWTSKSSRVTAKGNVKVQMGELATTQADTCLFSLDFSNVSLQGHSVSKIKM